MNRKSLGIKKFIIFDVMGVIFKVGDDANDLLVPFVRGRKNVAKEMILSLYKETSLGIISAYDFWQRLGFDHEEIMDVQKKYLETSLTLDERFIECASQLKKKIQNCLIIK